MYRRHLKESQRGDMESNRNQSSEFLERVSNVPVVYLAWNIAAGTYSSIKSSNSIIKVSLTSTENVVGLVYNPIIHRFRNQLKIVDSIAVKGFDALQAIIPAIVKQPERMYMHTKNRCNKVVDGGRKTFMMVKQLGASKVQDLAELSSQKVAEFMSTPYGQICEVVLDNALDIGEIYVDNYLPPLGDERTEKVFGDRAKLPVSKRSEVLSNRIRERMYKHTLLKIQHIRLKGKIMFAKIYAFNMSQYVMEIFISTPTRFYASAIRTFSNLHELILTLTTLVSSSHMNGIIE